MSAKCRDQFLVQSALISPNYDFVNLNEFWNRKEQVLHKHKLRVKWLPVEGQPSDKEGPSAAATKSPSADENPEPDDAPAILKLVSLNPARAFEFNRPLTVQTKQTLTITNNSAQPVAFKVYTVRPSTGRIEPGRSAGTTVSYITVTRLPMLEEPPMSTQCKDKFLIQSAFISPAQCHLTPFQFWCDKDVVIHEQKLCVKWLAATGQDIEGEGESRGKG